MVGRRAAADLPGEATATAGCGVPRALGVAGCGAGVGGLVLRWVSRDLGSSPMPPGLVVMVVAGAALVWARPFWLRLAVLVGLVLVGLQLGAAPRAWSGLAATARAGRLVEGVGLVIAVAAILSLLVRDRRSRPASPVRHPRRRRVVAAGCGWQVAGLLLLAPVCAEYLAAYDGSVGDPAQLLTGLVVFVPLYGCPALLIRELVSRRQLGGTGLAMLGVAFGVLQAGIVDRSLFTSAYYAYAGWDEERQLTFIGPLGISAYHAVNFVAGHLVFSITAPVALVAAARPATVGVPWVGRPGLVLAGLAYATASTLVGVDAWRRGGWQATRVQLVVTSLVVAVLVAAALARPAWQLSAAPTASGRRPTAPRLVFVACAAVALASVYSLAPATWAGTVGRCLILVVAAFALRRSSRLPGCGPQHVAAAAAGVLLVRGVLAFTYHPLAGEVSATAKHAHNIAMLLIVLTAVVLAMRPTRRPSTQPNQAEV